MAYDLALSEHGDLIISGNRDLGAVSGTDLIEQRIRIRLMIRKGSWVYDPDGNLGSQLELAINQEPDRAQASMLDYVRNALQPMDEIIVQDVVTQYADHSIILVVMYQLVGEDGEAEGDVQQLEISLQQAAEAGG